MDGLVCEGREEAMRLLAVALGLACCATSLAAQGHPRLGMAQPARTPAVLLTRARIPWTLSLRVPSSHWKRGAVIGWAIGTGAAFAYFRHHCPGESERDSKCLGFSVLAAPVAGFLFAIPGGLIGSMFP